MVGGAGAGGGGGVGMGCQWLGGLVFSSSDNSSGVVVGALVCGTDAITRASVWWEGLGEGLGMGCQWLAGLVSRVCL